MITHIRGQLIKKEPGFAVVEAGGLGYELSIPLSTFIGLPEPPAEVFLFTREVIREETWDFYGFLTILERVIFQALISVSRVGPKLALTIISALEVSDLVRALMIHDLAAIAGIKGIGAKMAERLMLELKDQVPQLAAACGLSGMDAGGDLAVIGSENEAVTALVNLGFTPTEAQKAAGAARREIPEADLGEVLRRALKWLSKPKK
ncbi:MAG: hypothetical protein AMR96_02485 [Candidatus Adiutrix intracellularis]|jgi:Holliday junction DNA helicase RuvA|nr:MAG: hypothetical protein AMR96_02485 [Candidatus Adiutrix intracellularis]MDR2826555.1 Holliday junction branch migration protein RuvA [Candidatus Adiutrix intracellularis]